MKAFKFLFSTIFTFLITFVVVIYMYRLINDKTSYVPLSYISSYFMRFNSTYWYNEITTPFFDLAHSWNSISISSNFWDGFVNFFKFIGVIMYTPINFIYHTFVKTSIDIFGFIPYILNY